MEQRQEDENGQTAEEELAAAFAAEYTREQRDASRHEAPEVLDPQEFAVLQGDPDPVPAVIEVPPPVADDLPHLCSDGERA